MTPVASSCFENTLANVDIINPLKLVEGSFLPVLSYLPTLPPRFLSSKLDIPSCTYLEEIILSMSVSVKPEGYFFSEVRLLLTDLSIMVFLPDFSAFMTDSYSVSLT